MRIESIEIKDFRQYQDQKFTFTHDNGKKDLHIIFAKNGVGKTNLVNAITWCLYDTEMHLGDRSTALEILNNQRVQSIREGLPTGGNALGDASVKITFSTDDGEEKIRFERVGKFNVSPEAVVRLKSDFTVMHYIDGNWNPVVSEEDTLAYVKRTVPEEIHDYIFFDGEHLESYFKAGQFENVKSGIEELTQAKILEKAENSFVNYIKKELAPLIKNTSSEEIAKAQEELDKIQEALDTADDTIQKMTTQIHKCEDDIAEQEKIISGHTNVSDKTERLKKVESLIEEAKEDIVKKKAEIMAFSREYIQYFALYPSIKSLYKYIIAQDQKGNLPPRIDKFLLETIEKEKHCHICDQDLNEHSISFIKKLREELEVSSETSNLLSKTLVSLRQYLTSIIQYKEKRTNLIKELDDLQKNEKELEQEQEKLIKYLMSIPNPEAITKAINLKKELNELRDKLIANRGAEEEHKKNLKNEYADKEKYRNSLIEKNKQLEKVRTKIDYCKECSKILKTTREELLEESRKEMESETFNTFNKLLWKKDAFSRVEILDDYTFRLLDNYGTQALGSCSAAERALLALSFTLALQKVSTHDSLLFIDTPIGRVDDENRINFVNTLCDIAKSKQVILTFTPTEYDDKVASVLQNQYATFSHLDMSDGITVIKN